MPDIAALAIVAATFFLAGAVKGVIGLGLPAISLAVLTVTIGLPQAMALMLVPSLVTNAWQAMTGGHGRVLPGGSGRSWSRQRPRWGSAPWR